jgi:signal transduction histidine kinase
MAKLAQQPAPPQPNGAAPDLRAAPAPKHGVGNLAVEMRTVVTPVIGYLELIAQEDEPMSADRHLRWIDTIEKRLEAMQELNDQIARTCAVLRDAVNESEAAPRRGPEAP